MKVKLEERYRSLYTLEDLDRAKAVIEAEREDEATPAEYAELAIRKVQPGHIVKKIYEATAHTARNFRANNNYTDDSGHMDIWIEFTAKTTKGFIEGGAYLSDIWGSTDYEEHMYYGEYTPEY